MKNRIELTWIGYVICMLLMLWSTIFQSVIWFALLLCLNLISFKFKLYFFISYVKLTWNLIFDFLVGLTWILYCFFFMINSVFGILNLLVIKHIKLCDLHFTLFLHVSFMIKCVTHNKVHFNWQFKLQWKWISKYNTESFFIG